MIGTLARYFGLRFFTTLMAVLAGVFMLIILLDYVEQMRRLSDVPNVSALLIAKTSLFRVPQIAERILPFCVLIGAMPLMLRSACRSCARLPTTARPSTLRAKAPQILPA